MRSFIAAMGAFLLAGVDAATKRGSCADLPKTGKADFDESQFMGQWYEVAKDSDFFDTDKSCSNETFQRKFNGELVVGKNTYDLADKWDQKQLNAVLNRTGNAEYVVFPDDTIGDRDANPNFLVRDTDYINYAVEYVCINIVPGKLFVESVSIKSREQTLSDSVIQYITLLLEQKVPDYDFSNLYFIDQCRICPFGDMEAIEIEE